MAQTFKDFVVECELYPYSKENFELMKECSELTLMEKYIENQRFLAESSTEFNSADITFTEGYFQESTDSATIATLMEETEVKKKNIFKRIWQGVINLLKRAGAFFGRLGNLFDATNREASAILKTLRKTELSKEDVSAIKGLIVNTKGDADANISAKSKTAPQPFATQLKLKYADGAFEFPAARVDFENELSLGLSTTTVVVRAAGEPIVGTDGTTKPGYSVGAIPADELISACKKLINAKKDYHAKDVISVIDGASADVVKNGLIIKANTKEIEKYITTLKDLEGKISEMLTAELNKPAGASNAEEGATVPPVIDANATTEISKAYAKISTCVAADIKIYNKYMQHRRAILTKLGSWLNTRGSAAGKSGSAGNAGNTGAAEE